MELGLPSRMQGLYHWPRCVDRLKSGDSSGITCWRLAVISVLNEGEASIELLLHARHCALQDFFSSQASYQSCGNNHPLLIHSQTGG